jgi:hypothetical protein
MRSTGACVWTQLPKARCGSESCAEVPWRPPPFDVEVGVEGGGVGHSAPSITTSVNGPMRTRSAGSLRRTPIARARHPFTQCFRLLNWDT